MLHLLTNLAAYAEPLTKIAGLIGALFAAWVWLKGICAKQAEGMSGGWTNEGDVLAPPRTHTVALHIVVKGSHVNGHLQAWEADGHSPLVSINGRRFGPYIRIELTHLERGTIVSYGFVTLKYSRPSARIALLTFRFKLDNGMFPVETTLWQSQRGATPDRPLT